MKRTFSGTLLAAVTSMLLLAALAAPASARVVGTPDPVGDVASVTGTQAPVLGSTVGDLTKVRVQNHRPGIVVTAQLANRPVAMAAETRQRLTLAVAFADLWIDYAPVTGQVELTYRDFKAGDEVSMGRCGIKARTTATTFRLAVPSRCLRRLALWEDLSGRQLRSFAQHRSVRVAWQSRIVAAATPQTTYVDHAYTTGQVETFGPRVRY